MEQQQNQNQQKPQVIIKAVSDIDMLNIIYETQMMILAKLNEKK